MNCQFLSTDLILHISAHLYIVYKIIQFENIKCIFNICSLIYIFSILDKDLNNEELLSQVI